MASKAPHFKLGYIYDDYNLYKVLYGSTLDNRAFEATNAVIAAETYHALYAKDKELNILELFGGHSEHRDLFISEARLPLLAYDCLEIQAHAKQAKHVKLGDATKTFPGDYNFVIAYYYSICSTMGEDDQIKRSILVNYFRNMRENLERAGGGAHYFNIGEPNTLGQTLLDMKDDVADSYYPIHPYHPIRRQFKIGPYEDLTLRTKEHKTFNRLTNTRLDFYEKVRLVRGKKEVIATYEIKKPFLLRDWTEPELTDIVQEAGFEKVHYFSNRKAGGMASADHHFCPLVVTNEDGPEEDAKDDDNSIDAYLATDMMVVVPSKAKSKPKKKKSKKK